MTTSDLNEHHVWRTNSDLRWTFVSSTNLCEALVQMARVLDDFDLEQWVTHLEMDVDDNGVITVGALTEQYRDGA